MSRTRTLADARRALRKLTEWRRGQRLGNRRDHCLRHYLLTVTRQVAASRIAAVALILALITGAPAAEGRWVQAVCTAYSPHDALDAEYRATKGADRWRTAYGVDVRESPYGVAAPSLARSSLGLASGTRIYVPTGEGYLDQSCPCRVFTVDDTGGLITSRTAESGLLHLDLRFRTEYSARRFGMRVIFVFIYHPEQP